MAKMQIREMWRRGATCEYNLDLSMVDLLSGYKNLLEDILNGKDNKRTKAK